MPRRSSPQLLGSLWKIAAGGSTGRTSQEPSLGQGCGALTGMLVLPWLFELGTSRG